MHHHCISVLQHGAPSNVLVLGLSSFLHIFGLLVNIFLPFSFPSPFPLLAQCDECLEDCMGAHGWVKGIASHMGRPVPVEAPKYLRYPSSIQHDAVVNHIMIIFSFCCLSQLPGKLIN